MPKDNQRRAERGLAAGRLLEVKKASPGDAAEGTFSGYGAVFGGQHPTSNWELMWKGGWMDSLAPGAFVDTLAAHEKAGTMPAMLWGHSSYDTPCGAWSSMVEDSKGLAVDGRLAVKTRKGEEIYELLKLDVRSIGLSIGFDVVQSSLDEKAKLRTIQKVDLYELSPVSIPAINAARITDAKSMTGKQQDQVGFIGNLILGGLQDMADGCGDCAAGDDCAHTDLIDKCQKLVDACSEGKSLGLPFDSLNIRHWEALARDAGHLSRSQAKALLAEGFKALSPRVTPGDGLVEELDKLRRTLTGA